MALPNRVYRLASRPVGLPTPANWSYTTEIVPDPADGEVLVKIVYISLDPAMRGWMNEGRSYVPPVGIGEVMRALTTGRVLESRHAGFVAGDYVRGRGGVQEYAIAKGDDLIKLDTQLAPLTAYIHVLGMQGMTAYFGLLDVGQPRLGETVVVSGAAGAVGSLVGQIAKIKGCRAVGIAGGAEKCAYLLNGLGFDAAIDYKHADVGVALREHCPQGVHVYFDNVGGEILDTVLTQIARAARIVLCGAISQYNNTTPARGPSNYLSLLVNRARMEGMIVTDYMGRYPEFLREMSAWLHAGKLKSRLHAVEGIENFPETFLLLFSGGNFGKLVLKVAEED